MRGNRIWIGMALVATIGCGLAAYTATTWWPRDNNSPVASPVQPSATQDDRQGSSANVAAADTARVARRVAAFCGDCHATPSADRFPRSSWYDEVERGFDFYLVSGRNDLVMPPVDEVVAYYEALAPDELPRPKPPSAATAGAFRFSPSRVAAEAAVDRAWTSFVRHLPALGGMPSGLWFTDMHTGDVRIVIDGRPIPIASLANPCHLEVCDLDGDGTSELVAADLGSPLPADHDKGRVVWLRPTAVGTWEQIALLSGLGRVADVRPADFDADGDQDLIVAEFGWRATGSIRLMRNEGLEGGVPRFETTRIDDRHGAIHIPIVDLNADGRPDFLALVSQEYEAIDAFLNTGDGTFERRELYAAGDPAQGSSGIEPCDLDADGDLDILYTNGDTFDSHLLKPYHAVQWLENTGELKFVHRPLGPMPGAHRALAGDIDGDGDQDIVAVAFLPTATLELHRDLEFDSIAIWERLPSGEYAYHPIEKNVCEHATCELADFDGDGDLDLAIGHFRDGRPNWVTIWRNDR